MSSALAVDLGADLVATCRRRFTARSGRRRSRELSPLERAGKMGAALRRVLRDREPRAARS